jgi:Putative prokaryotic signal transducing protein
MLPVTGGEEDAAWDGRDDEVACPGEDVLVQLVAVYESIDPIRGLLVRGLLESDGIRVLAKGEGSGPYRMGPVILMVWEDDAERARELVAASESGALAIPPADTIPVADTAAGDDRRD